MRFAISMAGAAALAALAFPADAKVLTYCADAAPQGFDPALYFDGATLDASAEALYDRLVEFGPGSTVLLPGLAQSWDVTPDGKTYTFHLRDNVAFSSTASFTPTRPLNADDVVFSLDRQVNKKNPYYAYASGGWPYYSAMGLSTLVKSVVKVDTATVRITLSRRDPSILGDLAMGFASIVSKEYADALGAAKTPQLLDQQPVGTGPFVLAGNENGKLTTTANAQYWGGAPKVDLTIVPVPNAGDRLAKLKSGDCDVIAQPDAASLKDAAADTSLTVASAPAADVTVLAFNTTIPPFDNPKVRQALGTAIDRQAIVDNVYGGAGVVATGILPADVAGAAGEATSDAYNVDSAKQLLAAAGVSNLSLKILATKEARDYNPDLAATANEIVGDLAKVGVNATVATPEIFGDYLRQSADKKREAAVVIGWSSENGDAASFLSLLLACDAVGKSNRSEWCNADFDKAIAAARAAPDLATLVTSLDAAQHIVAIDVPVAVLTHSLVAVPMKKAVTGVVADPLGRHNFAKADIAG